MNSLSPINGEYLNVRKSSQMNHHAYSLIFNQLMNISELSYDAISQYILNNDSYALTQEGIFDFIASLTFLVEYRSLMINLYVKLTKQLIDKISEKRFRRKIAKIIFETFFHYEPKDSIMNQRCYSRAYFLRLLYENGVYSMVEIVNLIHKYWEMKPPNKTPLFSLLVWFSPEIEKVNRTFFENLFKIAQKEFYSRKLPRPFIPFVQNIESLKKNEWQLYKETQKNEDLFFKVIQNDEVDQLNTLFQNSELNPNQKIEDKMFCYHWILQSSPTILQIAAFFGSIKCFSKLFQLNPDFSLKDSKNFDVVDFAGAGGSFEILELLKENGIDIRKSLKMATLFHRKHIIKIYCMEFKVLRETYLVEACQSNHDFFLNTTNLSKIEIDLTIPAKSNSFLLIPPKDYPKQYLHNNLKNNMNNNPNDSINSHCSMVQYVNVSESFLIASEYGNLRFIQWLINNCEFDVNTHDSNGKTAVQIAGENCQSRILKYLITIDKININEVLPISRKSLLHISVLNNTISIAKALIKNSRFNMNMQDNEGSTPLHYACRNVNTIGTHLVLDLSIVKEEFISTPENYIFNYSKIINLEMFQLFLRAHKADFEIYDNYGLTPLHYLARNGRIDFAIELFNQRPEINFRIPSKDLKRTPLHFAAENDRPCFIFYYLQHCPESQKDQDINGQTPLQIACTSGHPECSKLLSDYPEVVNFKDKWDRTALLISAAKGRTGCIRQMAQIENIDLNYKDNYGRTALKIAYDHNHYLSAQLLEIVKAEK
ncbi:hypothetical protein TRFO_15471 [Tritrichomonas foetus]|uniref:DUF3447 domain-containing protein n=1 Tax=Tritrichomonas foetus TaxID=1144522 RepID=A0A1J4KSF1_9EUKA|nr:hypothetical protein TRFO_15471 [Tritrichomonas foetus]|eukprot:OHT14187.1 hypothetical protein TRFO_15471 [Tritrichomonas foetus]